jgi:hypothetical protein
MIKMRMMASDFWLFLQDLAMLINLRKILHRSIALIATLLLAYKLISIAFLIHDTAAPKSVVYANDNDAGRGIQTATLTTWYNSNHFGPYGNLYFRIAHTFAKLGPQSSLPAWTSEENNERTHHIALMITSLFALTAFCLFLSYLLLEDLTLSLFLTNILLYFSLKITIWSELIFRVHPDHLLMLTIAISTYFTLRYTKNSEQKDFTLSALIWGLATAVKRSTVLFIFSFLYLFLSEGLNKKSVLKGARFIGLMLLAYLIIGFPQNFGFYKHIKFMLHESHNSRPPTMASISEYLLIIYEQIRYLIPSFIVAHMFFGKRSDLINFRFVIFILLALGMTISNRMVTPHIHHPMPVVAAMLIGFIFLIKRLPVLAFSYKQPIFLILIFVAMYFTREIPEVFARERLNQLKCRPEVLNLLTKVKELQKNGQSILGRDPYFPFDSSQPKLSVQYWGASMPDLDRDNVSILGLQRSFGTQFLEEEPGYNMSEKALNWTDKKILYQKSLSETEFTTPAGRTFMKVHEDQCGFQLWTKR